MSMRYPGGLIATSPVNAAYPSGVWTQAQAIPYQSQNVWTRDQYWPYTTLLLQGNGTNGAQNNTFLDSSTNNFTITRNGNTTQGSFTPYEANGYWSNYFDGSGDWLIVTSPGTAFNFGTGDFTIEGWLYFAGVQPDGPASNVAILFGTHNVGVAAGWDVQASPTHLAWETYGSGGTSAIGTGVSMPIGTWNHFAACRSGSTLRLFANGVLVGSTTENGNYSSTANNPTIGADVGGNRAQFFGYLSNLRVLKGTALYTAAFTPPTSPLTAITNTSLLTCQSNRFLDNSTNAFVFTVNGETSVQAFQPFPGQTTYSTSVLGGSGYFDGTGDYLQAGTNSNLALGSGNFTIEGWHYCTGYNGGGVLYSTINTYPSSTGLLFYIDSIGRYTIDVNGTILQPAGTAVLNAWVHWAVVRNGSTLSIYINGTSIGSVSSSTNFTDQYAIIGRTGAGTNSNLFLGYLSNTRMVKGTAVYTANFTPPTAPVTAISNTQFLCDFTNAGISDAAMMNDLETVGNAQVSTSVVKYGTGSMAFDGSGDYLTLLSTQLLTWGTGDFTIEMWVNTSTTSVSGGASRTMWGTSSASYQGQMYLEVGTGKVVFGNTGSTFIKGSKNVADGAWHHIAVCRNGTTCRLFVDGVQDASGTNSVNYDAQVTYVGAFGPSDGYFNGYIDDLRITKGAARYITNFTPPPARMPGQ